MRLGCIRLTSTVTHVSFSAQGGRSGRCRQGEEKGVRSLFKKRVLTRMALAHSRKLSERFLHRCASAIRS
jgi:hypothetical protein